MSGAEATIRASMDPDGPCIVIKDTTGSGLRAALVGVTYSAFDLAEVTALRDAMNRAIAFMTTPSPR